MHLSIHTHVIITRGSRWQTSVRCLPLESQRRAGGFHAAFRSPRSHQPSMPAVQAYIKREQYGSQHVSIMNVQMPTSSDEHAVRVWCVYPNAPGSWWTGLSTIYTDAQTRCAACMLLTTTGGRPLLHPGGQTQALQSPWSPLVSQLSCVQAAGV